MSQDTINRIAAALLPYVKTTAAADTLLDAVNPNSRAITEMEARFSSSSALTHRRGSVDKAITAAAGCSDPETLLAFTKDSRLSVQRFVAEHIERLVDAGASPEPFEPALARLAAQAYKRLAGSTPAYEDRDVLAVTARLRAIGKALEDLGNPNFPVTALRQRLLTNLSEPEMRAALASGEPTLVATVLEVLNHHRVGGLTLTEALEQIRDLEVYEPALSLAFFTARVLNTEITSAFLALDGDHWPHARANARRYGMPPYIGSSHMAYLPAGLDTDNNAFPRFSVESAKLIMAPGTVPDSALFWVFDQPVPEEAFELALERLRGCSDSYPSAAFASANAAFMDAQHIELFVKVMMEEGRLAEHLVVHPFRQLIPENTPAATLYELFNHLDYPTVIAWLMGDLGRKPVPGEVHGWLQHNPELRSDVRETLSRCTLSAFSRFAPEMRDEVLDACGTGLGQLVLRSNEVAAHVAKRLEAGIGDDEEVWRTVLPMCEELGDERIESLITAVRTTLGRSTEPVAPELFERSDGQLSFLP
jgi:hypothetical protein